MINADAAIVCGLAFAAAFVGTLSGFGFALLIVPPLSLVVGPKNAVILANGLSPLQNVAQFLHLRRHIHWEMTWRLFAAALVGMPVGLLVLTGVSTQALRLIIAATVLAATLVLWRGWRLARRGLVMEGVVGFISGALNTSTSMNGPPVVLYLQGLGTEPQEFRATLSAYFTISSVIAVAMFAASKQLSSETAWQIVVSTPALFAGWYVGNHAFTRLDPRRFRLIVFGVLLASAAIIIATALLG